MTSWLDVVSDSRCMTGTCDTFKMSSFSVMQPTFRFSNVEIPTKIWSTVPKCQKLYSWLVVGTARISTLEKRNVDCMTEKLNISFPSPSPSHSPLFFHTVILCPWTPRRPLKRLLGRLVPKLLLWPLKDTTIAVFSFILESPGDFS